MDLNMEDLLSVVRGIKDDLGSMKDDMGSMRRNIESLKGDIGSMKNEIRSMSKKIDSRGALLSSFRDEMTDRLVREEVKILYGEPSLKPFVVRV
jgi:peptidoglycan hydrolase CwlO-like protein